MSQVNPAWSVCIVGSLRFSTLMFDVSKVFAKAGIPHSVPTPGKYRNPDYPGEYTCGYSKVTFEEKLKEEKKRVLAYLERVRLSDVIYIVNPNGYVGFNTVGEIFCAYENKKSIYALEPMREDHSLFLTSFLDGIIAPEDLVCLLQKTEKPLLLPATH